MEKQVYVHELNDNVIKIILSLVYCFLYNKLLLLWSNGQRVGAVNLYCGPL
jgi:hypothetical protein